MTKNHRNDSGLQTSDLVEWLGVCVIVLFGLIFVLLFGMVFGQIIARGIEFVYAFDLPELGEKIFYLPGILVAFYLFLFFLVLVTRDSRNEFVRAINFRCKVALLRLGALFKSTLTYVMGLGAGFALWRFLLIDFLPEPIKDFMFEVLLFLGLKTPISLHFALRAFPILAFLVEIGISIVVIVAIYFLADFLYMKVLKITARE